MYIRMKFWAKNNFNLIWFLKHIYHINIILQKKWCIHVECQGDFGDKSLHFSEGKVLPVMIFWVLFFKKVINGLSNEFHVPWIVATKLSAPPSQNPGPAPKMLSYFDKMIGAVVCN